MEIQEIKNKNQVGTISVTTMVDKVGQRSSVFTLLSGLPKGLVAV